MKKELTPEALAEKSRMIEQIMSLVNAAAITENKPFDKGTTFLGLALTDNDELRNLCAKLGIKSKTK